MAQYNGDQKWVKKNVEEGCGEVGICDTKMVKRLEVIRGDWGRVEMMVEGESTKMHFVQKCYNDVQYIIC